MASNSKHPNHWDLLNEDDKEIYRQISAALSAPTSKNKRNKKIDDFTEVIVAIERFENTDEKDRWKRCLVCGVCQLSNGIAVNITQLKRLVFKCKSSINGSLKGMGYDTVVSKTSACEELLEAIPYLRNNTTELRQWTVRLRSGASLPASDTTPPQPDFAFDCGNSVNMELSLGTSPDAEQWDTIHDSDGDFADVTLDF